MRFYKFISIKNTIHCYIVNQQLQGVMVWIGFALLLLQVKNIIYQQKLGYYTTTILHIDYNINIFNDYVFNALKDI